MSAPIRVGTAPRADESLKMQCRVKAGERLPYYAEHFDTVEVDSTYYRLPDEPMVVALGGADAGRLRRCTSRPSG